MFARGVELLHAGAIGEVEHLEVVFDGAVPRTGPESVIYLDPSLGGGALLHQACYALHAVRSLVGAEPDVVRASAVIGETGVDEAVDVDLVFASGTTARARSSMQEGAQPTLRATLRGRRGAMTLDNFIGPHYGNVVPGMGGRITVTNEDGTALDESFTGETTYTYQLRAFCDAARGGRRLPVQGAGAVANMALIDAVRAAAVIPPPARSVS
jgi:predicted dehydrogenase